MLPAYASEIAASEKRKKYHVVAVLNPGDGPDEQLLFVYDVEWDDQIGYMRLLVE